MPGLLADGDAVVATKKRYDCFLGTDLEQVLRAANRDCVLLMGVNTNSHRHCAISTSVNDDAVFV